MRMKIVYKVFSILGMLWLITDVLLVFGVLEVGILEKMGFKGSIGLLFVVFVLYLLFEKPFKMKRTKITIAQFGKYLPYLPLYIAEKKGFFKAEGLDVSFDDSGGDDKTWKKIVNNEAQFGVGDPTILSTQGNDCKGKLIASLMQKACIYGVTKKKIPNINKIEDFEGYKVAVFKKPNTIYEFAQYINRINSKNLSLKPLELIEIDHPDKIYNYANDANVDITMAVEPIATDLETKGFDIIFSGAKLFPNILFTGIFVTENYLKENREIVQSFISALNKSLEFIQNDHPATLKIATQEFPKPNTPLDIEIATLKLFRQGIFPVNSIVNEDSWQEAFKMRFEDIAPNEYKFKDFVDNTFTQEAIKNRKK